MVVMCGLPAFAYAADTGVSKEETVYVVTNSTGEQQDVIVSDHLVNKGKVKTISDETTLSDIENVKGEETFKQNGDALTWDAGGNSIYYQGKTTEEVPVTMDVTYRLDDKVVSGPELQGKSGKVEIRIHYENTATYEGSTVPFIVMTGLVVTDETFKNIKVSKGKVIDDGDKLMVVGMAAPGLAQTLDIGETDLGIGSTVIISGDADKFAVEDMMTVVTNAFFEDVDSGKLGDLDYDDEISQLNKGSKALVDGSDKLYEGLDTLAENMPTLKSGVKKLKDGSKELEKGTKGARDGAKALNSGVNELGTKLAEKLQEMFAGVGQIKDGMGDAADALTDKGIAANGGAKQYISGAEDALDLSKENITNAETELSAMLLPLVQAGTISQTDYQSIMTKLGYAKGYIDGGKKALGVPNSETIATSEDESTQTAINFINSSDAVMKGVVHTLTEPHTAQETKPTLYDGITALSDGIKDSLKSDSDLSKGMTSLKNGSSDLAKGEEQLAGGAKQLADGMTALNDNAGKMSDGVSKLDNGAYKLRKGMKELYDQGIKKIVDLYNDDLKGTLDNVDGMLDAGKGYKTFTKLPSSMDGNVKFIYKTDMTE